MTRAQEMEIRRFTPRMREMLHYAGKAHPQEDDCGPFMRTTRLLVRRGFLTVGGARSIRLTEAGREALAWRG
jgi:hypothetical protein